MTREMFKEPSADLFEELVRQTDVRANGALDQAREAECDQRMRSLKEIYRLSSRVQGILEHHSNKIYLDLESQRVTPNGLLTCFRSAPLLVENLDDHVSLSLCIRRYDMIPVGKSTDSEVYFKSEISYVLHDSDDDFDVEEAAVHIFANGDVFIDNQFSYDSSHVIKPSDPEWQEVVRLVDHVDSLFEASAAA